MPLITQIVPSTWQELEIGVRDILAECGMDAERQVQIPLVGIPGRGRLLDAGDEAAADAYYAVWKKYLFAGLMLQRFSPYLMLFRQGKIAELPIELPMSPEGEPLVVPDDVREAKGYRELFQRLTAYGLEGLRELRSHNPVTRGVPEDQVESDD